jgi:GDP-L-fucose synthase
MKILITGGTGMVGASFKNLKTSHDLVLVGSSDYDLRKASECKNMINDIKPDSIIHLAAKVGGVKSNSIYMSDFFYDNVAINSNVLECSRKFKIKKVLSLLSTCIYPNNVNYPLTENQIHFGEPHQSNFGYAYAKRMLDVHSRAIRKQYGLNYITAVPNNIYGQNDNFDLENGHVIPAIIRKIYESKESGIPPVFWGSGKPLREFTYSQDIASALMFLIENYNCEKPINIGNTKEYSIKEIVKIVSNFLNYRGEVIWDDSMPEGQFKKPSSNKNFLKINPDFKYTSLKSGLKETCSWFIKNYPSVRGV